MKSSKKWILVVTAFTIVAIVALVGTLIFFDGRGEDMGESVHQGTWVGLYVSEIDHEASEAERIATIEAGGIVASGGVRGPNQPIERFYRGETSLTLKPNGQFIFTIAGDDKRGTWYSGEVAAGQGLSPSEIHLVLNLGRGNTLISINDDNRFVLKESSPLVRSDRTISENLRWLIFEKRED